MLNAKTALFYVESIEIARAKASKIEDSILAELRSLPDYEQNADQDVLEAVRLRAEARELSEQADTILSAFDWVYDEATGQNVRKVDQRDAQ